MIDPLDKCILLEAAAAEFFDPPLSKDAFRSWAKAAGVPIIRNRPQYVRRRECLAALARPISSSTKNEEPGSSETALSASEQALALKAKLRLASRNTSREASSPRQRHRH